MVFRIIGETVNPEGVGRKLVKVLGKYLKKKVILKETSRLGEVLD